MKKIIIILLIIFMVGCAKDVTEGLCFELEIAHADENVSIYMNNGYCVLEEINYTHAVVMECNHLLENAILMMKTQDKMNETDFEDMPRGCKTRELK